MYTVFSDFHHAGLLNSLIMLFEGRLGGALYRPIGMEWAQNGFWKVYDHPATQLQFLGIGGATPDGSRPLNEVANVIDGVYHCKDIESDTTNKAITFDAFMKMKIDIVIASIPAHVEPFKRLCQLHPNRPKLIFQIGNAWTMEAAQAPNIMASAIIGIIPAGINFISYHQEFDLNVFKPDETIVPEKVITSFVNCFNTQDHFRADWFLFLDVERKMSDWKFKCLGAQGRDGNANGTKEVAAAMRSSKFIWHTKNGGDGYGHIIHNAGAVGKPLIVNKSYYKGKMAEKLLIDGKTCIDINGLSMNEIIRRIEHANEPKVYAQMCKDSYENFKQVVDFDREFMSLTKFLEVLV